MRRLADRGHQVDVQILDNKVSTDFKINIVEDWCGAYQLVPLRAIKKINFETWPGLTHSNAAKYSPHAEETIKGHMVQSSQGVQSTN